MRLTLAQASGRYGEILDGKWENEAQWCVLYSVPAEIAPTWINSATGKPTTHIYVNKEVVPSLDKALAFVIERGLVSELQTFDGCLMVRAVRGEPNSLSNHAYACALDINAATNQLGAWPTLSAALVACFLDAGFSWGGNFKRKDGMHFSCGWE